MEEWTNERKHRQILKEMKATLLLFVCVAVWHIGFGFALDGVDVFVFGMPLWFFVSTIGSFVIAVVGVVILLKKVFVNFPLDDEIDEEETEGGIRS